MDANERELSAVELLQSFMSCKAFACISVHSRLKKAVCRIEDAHES